MLPSAFIPSQSILLRRTTQTLVHRHKPHFSQCSTRIRLIPRASGESEDSSSSETDPQTSFVETTRIPEQEALDPNSNTEIIKPTFNLAGSFLFVGGACFYAGDGWIVLGLPVLAIGILLSVQTFRVRFVFGPKKFSIGAKSGDGLKLIVGWDYDQITNWEVWWPFLPILAYFKESESYGGRGSIHFFPMVCAGKELVDALKKNTPQLKKDNYS